MWKWAYGVICVKCVDNYVLRCHQNTLASLSSAKPSPRRKLCKAVLKKDKNINKQYILLELKQVQGERKMCPLSPSQIANYTEESYFSFTMSHILQKRPTIPSVLKNMLPWHNAILNAILVLLLSK